MKSRLIPMNLILVAFLLLNGLAYALEKNIQEKPVDQLSDAILEEETLKAELLAATEEHQSNMSIIVYKLKNGDVDRPDVKKDQLKIKEDL